MNIQQIFRDNVIDRGWPFTGESGESRYRFNEEAAYYAAKQALIEQGIEAAWVVASIWQGQWSAWLIEGDYTRYFHDKTGLSSDGPTKCDGVCEQGTYTVGYFEDCHGFTQKFHHLPVIFPDGSIGEMSPVDDWGRVKIKKA